MNVDFILIRVKNSIGVLNNIYQSLNILYAKVVPDDVEKSYKFKKNLVEAHRRRKIAIFLIK